MVVIFGGHYYSVRLASFDLQIKADKMQSLLANSLKPEVFPVNIEIVKVQFVVKL